MANIKDGEWISAQAGAELLGVSRGTFLSVVATGGITIRRLPGTLPRFSRSDVERIRRESFSQAEVKPVAV